MQTYLDSKSLNLSKSGEVFNIISRAPKGRRADEFLKPVDAIEKQGEDEELKKKREELESFTDETLDTHALQGIKVGRGNRFWYEISSETVHKSPAYGEWHI